MNEINFWNGLTDEEKKIAMEAVAVFQEAKLRKEKIDALKEEIFNNVLHTFHAWTKINI